MAESRYTLKGIGLPFDPSYSSCSNLKPTKFDWSITTGDVDIHVDRGILLQPNLNTPKTKRFGWVCESKYIIPDVYSFIIHNHKLLFENYYNKIYTCDSDLLVLNPNFFYVANGSNYPWIPKKDWAVYNKTKLCSMFCSPKRMTEGHVYRHQLARLGLDLGVDVFGGAHGTQRTVVDPRNPWNTKLDGVKDYMFSVVIENGVYDSYTTEKLTDCFASGTVPIYWGTKQLPKIFDPNGVIWLEVGNERQILESLSPELYISKQDAVIHNLAALDRLTLADDDLFEMMHNETNNI